MSDFHIVDCTANPNKACSMHACTHTRTHARMHARTAKFAVKLCAPKFFEQCDRCRFSDYQKRRYVGEESMKNIGISIYKLFKNNMLYEL